MASTYTTNYKIEKPEYKVLRFDTPLNANFDLIDSGLKCFPSATALGVAGNHPEFTLTEGMMWRDTTNHLTKIRMESAAWESIHTNVRANLQTDIAAPASPSAGSHYHYAAQQGGISVPHWKTSSGQVMNIQQVAHVADIDATAIASGDNSTGNIDKIKTVVDDLRTKFNAHLVEHESMGLHATS